VEEQLLEAWRTNHRINLFLIDAISEEGMACTLSKRGGRNVTRQFAHVHNNRLYHLEKRAPDLAKGIVKFESKEEPDKATLKKAMDASSKAIEKFLSGILNGEPKRKGFKKGIFTTFGYLVAHESHHRGSILLTLKECGYKLGNDVSYAIWDWDRR